MRNSEKLYNTEYKLIQTSSDLCSFTYPQYEVVGFDVITPTITLESPNVFLVDGPIDIPVNITFTTNLEQLNENIRFNYQILTYSHSTGKFISPSTYISPVFKYVDVNHVSSVNTNSLSGEGEYIFKLGYQFDACTFIAQLMGKRYVSNTFNASLPYGNYDGNNDKYFVVLYKADEPRLDIGPTDGGDGGTDGGNTNTQDRLINRPLAVEDGVKTYTLQLSTTSDVVITLNGSTLQPGVGNDYVLEGSVLTFSEPLVQSDVVNYIIIGKSSASTLRSETIDINSFISEGPTGGEGTDKVYENTDTGKYEIYTDFRIKNKDSLVVTINGVTLSNGVDYYVSNSNPKRIILEGDLIVGDVINILYDSGENVARTITAEYIDVTWYVVNEIKIPNGEFIIEFATDSLFLDIVQTEVVPYEALVLNYTERVPMNYPYGQVLYYRVRNIKKYVTLVGVELVTENVSDVVRIEIKTNISNNY